MACFVFCLSTICQTCYTDVEMLVSLCELLKAYDHCLPRSVRAHSVLCPLLCICHTFVARYSRGIEVYLVMLKDGRCVMSPSSRLFTKGFRLKRKSVEVLVPVLREGLTFVHCDPVILLDQEVASTSALARICYSLSYYLCVFATLSLLKDIAYT